MSLYDTIAASHRGQCFALLGRRFSLDEIQVADIVYAMLRELTASLDVAIADRNKLASFLSDLGQGDYLRLLTDPTVFANQQMRDRGMTMLSIVGAVRPVQLEAIVDADNLDGVDVSTCRQMLPCVTLLMLAAIRHKAERPLRRILAARQGERAAQSTQDPFATLAASLVEPPQPKPRPTARLVDAILGRSAPAMLERRSLAS